jgi:hypothetical protein
MQPGGATAVFDETVSLSSAWARIAEHGLRVHTWDKSAMNRAAAEASDPAYTQTKN